MSRIFNQIIHIFHQKSRKFIFHQKSPVFHENSPTAWAKYFARNTCGCSRCSEVWHLVLYIPPKEQCVPPKKTCIQLKEPYIQPTELRCHFRQKSPMSLVGHLWQNLYRYIYINIYIYMKKPYISSCFFGVSGTHARNITPPRIAEDSETCFYYSCSSEDRDTANCHIAPHKLLVHGTSPVLRQKNILWGTETCCCSSCSSKGFESS